jgi:hypothetical protein
LFIVGVAFGSKKAWLRQAMQQRAAVLQKGKASPVPIPSRTFPKRGSSPMSKPVVEVQVRAVVTAGGGCAVFLGNEDKVFVMIG